MKNLTALLALTAGLVLTTGAKVSADDDYYDQPSWSYTVPPQESYRHQVYMDALDREYLTAPLMIVQPVRDTAADAATLYMYLNPAAQIAEGMGLLDRGLVTGMLRGF